jgi:hypothetical protein
MDAVSVGIDVSKRDLVIAVHSTGEQWTTATTPAAIATLVMRVRALGPRIIVVEATGGYERALVAAMAVAEMPVAARRIPRGGSRRSCCAASPASGRPRRARCSGSCRNLDAWTAAPLPRWSASPRSIATVVSSAGGATRRPHSPDRRAQRPSNQDSCFLNRGLPLKTEVFF